MYNFGMADLAPPVPRYHQLRLILAQRIREGRYSDAFSMPGERELALEFGVARVTVRAALKRLEEEGLVVRLRGRGTLAVERPENQPTTALRGGPLDNLASMSRRTKAKVLDMAWIPAPPHVASALRIATHERTLKVTRIRTFKRQPISYSEVFVPRALARDMTRQALNDDPVFVLLENQGVRIASAEQTIHAVNATPEAAEALGLPEGTALLKIARTYLDEAGTPTHYLSALFHPTRYEQHMRLSRTGRETRLWVTNDERGEIVETPD
ncbi:HTH gntR-type domain-containing protein [Paraburkholderia unamae]|nr:GntR family transcriptional regulator [Paraburkholderia unamae]CAG9266132.1 HTH gntR-type domain-containing protein [Paraburkholderia unamae]